MRGEYAVSLHDVAPATWPACERLLELADAHAVPATLLVVPHYHAGTRADRDLEFGAALRRRVARGDEVVLHGYHHEDRGARARSPGEWLARRILTAGEGEFAAIDASSAAALIARGRAVLATLGLAPAGFVAPAWLMNAATVAALRASGLRYAASRDDLIELRDGRRVAAPSLVYSTRARWRRVLSKAWNAARLATLNEAPRIRAALHPADAGHAAVLADWTRLLGRLATERRGVLESHWLGAAR
ncbi:MAG TPA: polysaccharide deacetylase family protein [Steroidobacteraceae bacterium]|nr:polysaccharide deacetylase family protein [Steroidobacteraceae bacterium]